MEGYTYLSPLSSDPNAQKFAMGVFLGAALLAVGAYSTRRLRRSSDVRQAVVPPVRPSLPALVDVFMEGFIKYFDSILGKERRKYVPFCASVFIFVLVCNLIGLVSGMPAVTTTVWVNVGMAFVVFFTFNALGVREHGLIGYLKHFCGPVVFVAPLMFPLEILSTCLRILTLNMRLYWNITADHLVLATFTDLTKYVVPVVFYAMGTFVCFMQAFVFATLTMIYILLATQHEEHH